MSHLNERAARFRNQIRSYIRRLADEKHASGASAKELAKFDPDQWLQRIASLSTSIQLATHPSKATHPDISINESTSPFILHDHLSNRDEIGSHSVDPELVDGTGNAAALGVSKFLTEVVVDGKPLYKWLIQHDPDFISSISDDRESAKGIFDKLSSIDRRTCAPASHSLAKQVYWLVGSEPSDDSHFLLLQPCFSSSLTHMVHAEIQDARFGEVNKLARQAYRDRKPHDKPYRYYSGLVVRNLGGTKPQNVSQLNSERRGINYLLDSSPPNWVQERALNLRNTKSAFYAFRWFDNVEHLLRELQKLLRTDPSPNQKTREHRKAIEKGLGQQLVQFGAAVRGSHPPGWTRDVKCRLPLCEQLWLDSERTELPPRTDEHAQDDIEFNNAYTHGDWPNEVAQRFGAWLNDRLRAAGINTVGDSELRHWSRQAIIDAQWPILTQRRAQGGAA